MIPLSLALRACSPFTLWVLANPCVDMIEVPSFDCHQYRAKSICMTICAHANATFNKTFGPLRGYRLTAQSVFIPNQKIG